MLNSRPCNRFRSCLRAVVLPALLAAVAVAMAGCATRTNTIVLITPEEYSGQLLAKSQGCDLEGPKILVVSPYLDPPNPPPDRKPSLSVPFGLDVRFEPQASARVLPETFKVFYQMWIGEKDIADRLRKEGKAKVTEARISASSVSVPSGNYRLRLEVSDDKNKVGCKYLEFSVVK